MSHPPTLITSRPLDEYCRLFGLTRSSLGTLPGPVLDCPGGAAGLVAEARALGCQVIAADPLYALPAPDRTALARAGRAAIATAAGTDPGRYLPGGHAHRPEKYLRSWDRAHRLFAADSAAHPDRYIAAALPRLPFAEGTFALTLSSYLLFAYPELFAADDQLAALLELVRVTAPEGEVRVHPLYDGSGRRCPHLPELRATLGAHRISTEIRRVAPSDRAGRPHRILILRAVNRRSSRLRTPAGIHLTTAQPTRRTDARALGPQPSTRAVGTSTADAPTP
ncbi:hypothetical protein GCM10010441_39010 [Kitasatospora paracochleata]|uniref:Methyltransferase family protein n=1 Tax=Kitasatospora paracochleata TaxID=58354 RepID=A0ABT1IPD4_9ACTN|nr:class I SAM-dependent methyltransferase [Kitasatospora paracochleata]MCP2306983.1 hypothetical protein [Kitasatospora paracochleata]